MSKTMKFRGFGWALGALFGVCFVGHAFAQAASSPLQFTNAVLHEVEVKAADGKVTRKLVPVLHAVPGDEVVYEIAYKNSGKAPVTDIVVNNPLPKEMIYVGASTQPTAVSVDGGKKYGELTDLTVTLPNGAKRPALASDITHLRWVVSSLAGGASGKVTFRAKVK
jgi:uncharacterized repeat protein (TIGR01451 family)